MGCRPLPARKRQPARVGVGVVPVLVRPHVGADVDHGPPHFGVVLDQPAQLILTLVEAALDGAQDALRVGPGPTFAPRLQVRQVGQDFGPDVVFLQVGGQRLGGPGIDLGVGKANLVQTGGPFLGDNRAQARHIQAGFHLRGFRPVSAPQPSFLDSPRVDPT